MAWIETTLGDLVTLQRGFDLPNKDRIPGEVPVLSAGEKLSSHNEAKVSGPGFVIGRSSNLGVPRWSDEDFWPLNTTLFAKDFKGNNPRWLFYLFQTLDLTGFNSGTAQASLNRNYISGFKVTAPSRPEQDRIVGVLGALDDKIAANNEVVQRAKTLSTAFVGIDFEDSSRTSLKDVTSLISRGVTPRYDDAGGYTVLNQKCIRDSRVNVALSRTMKSLPKSPEKILRKNDVLVNSTGQGTLGRIARWISPDPNVAVDTHVSIIRFNPDLTDPAFAGTILSTMERLVEDLAEGSTGQTELKRDLLGRLELNLPPLEKQRQVGQKITFLDEFCHARAEENTVLASTRDELLPLLMNGKITVREAKQEAAAAGASVPTEESEA